MYKPAAGRISVRTDLYVAGLPCVKFSALGHRTGEPDPVNSTFELSIVHIETALPGAFVLENVVGLMSFDCGRFLACILERLRVGGHYAVRHAVYDAKRCCVPQSRRRIYIVGVSVHLGGEDFVLPGSDLSTPPLSSFLGPRLESDDCRRMPPSSQRNATRVLHAELAMLRRESVRPSVPDRVLDIDASPDWASRSATVAPCLTHSRAQGLWLLSCGRRLSPAETLGLQGIPVDHLLWSMKGGQARAAAGNAVCVYLF